jgi:hypoxanthine phosphoribosyltransferase
MPAYPQKPEDFADCLYTREEIDQALDGLATRITTRYATLDPLVVTVLNGGLVMAGHLITRLAFPLRLDYIHATRYRGAQTGDKLHWLAPPHTDLAGRHVLLLDDILDEGYTLEALEQYCHEQRVASVASAVLLKKIHPRTVADISPEFVALEVEDRYVFGFGMDLEHEWRNANGIFALREE